MIDANGNGTPLEAAELAELAPVIEQWGAEATDRRLELWEALALTVTGPGGFDVAAVYRNSDRYLAWPPPTAPDEALHWGMVADPYPPGRMALSGPR